MAFNMGEFTIGSGRTFVIAEIGNNHNGNFDLAVEMVNQAVDMGADCVKFQMRQLDQVYRKRSLDQTGEDLGTEYIVELLNRFELSTDQHRQLVKYCSDAGIMYMCTPWDAVSAKILDSFGVPGFKVASADLTNTPLIQCLVAIGKPLILSTGMSTLSEVSKTVDLLRQAKAHFALLHCNSTYPAPFHDINLRWIRSLGKLHDYIGYSGHERGIGVSIGAVALGACIVERHFTLDRSMEGPDHAASLTREEFSRLITGIREVEQALGTGDERVLSQGEMINRENLAKSLVASRSLKSGHILTTEDVSVRSPGQGLSPQRFDELVGKVLVRNIEKEEFFFEADLEERQIMPGQFSFARPWGVPVRYHDFEKYSAKISPDLWEFHLSYSDMDLKPDKYIENNQSADFVVHAPELFSGSRLMDLASPDKEYRSNSINETQQVIDITRELKRLFPAAQRPLIVANVGGFTMDEPLPAKDITAYYERFGESLTMLDMDDVELIPQTMAPFPWHFGGQRYQNLFIRIEEIKFWCERLGLRMCFDVSHSRLASNHLEFDFYDFAAEIAPITAHIHMGDASGVNGEGLQIGNGDIDFVRLGKILRAGCPTASFIPEIWQGHKNDGVGFWTALSKLESCL